MCNWCNVSKKRHIVCMMKHQLLSVFQQHFYFLCQLVGSPSSQVALQVTSQVKCDFIVLRRSSKAGLDLQDAPSREQQRVVEESAGAPVPRHHPLLQGHALLGSIPVHRGLWEIYHCTRMDRVTGLRLDNTLCNIMSWHHFKERYNFY